MNILFISTNYPYPPDHGHNLRTYNILKYLAMDHNIFYLAFTKNKKDLINHDPIKEICESVDVFMTPDDFSKFRMRFSLLLNCFSWYPYIAQKYYKENVRNRIKQIIMNNKIDLIHFDLLHLSRYVNDVGTIPKALTEHNVESLRVQRLARNSRNIFLKSYMYLQYKKLFNFERKACPKFDVCIAVSQQDLNTLKRMSPEAKFFVIPNGVDTTFFRPRGVEPKPKSLIWVGGMGDMYNREAVDYFCEDIFPKIHNEIKDVKFIAVGKSPTGSFLKLSANNKNVIASGYVDDIRPYMDSATVFIAPIKSGGGTKLKVLNALSMAKPVVTTTVGAEGIEVKNGENILIADDAETFAKCTVELLRDPERAREIGKKGRDLILKKYDWEIIRTKQNQLYNDIVTFYKNHKKHNIFYPNTE